MTLDFPFVKPKELGETLSCDVVSLSINSLSVPDTGEVNLVNEIFLQRLLVLILLHGDKFQYFHHDICYGICLDNNSTPYVCHQ